MDITRLKPYATHQGFLKLSVTYQQHATKGQYMNVMT
jgi:hypothetical protein